MRYDRKHLMSGLTYAVAGMGLGIFMAASHDHAQHVTHAHILLVGFVTSLIYGVIHKLWLGESTPKLAKAQYIVHNAGAVVLFIGLFFLFGNLAPATRLDPILAAASFTVLAGALLMFFMVIKASSARP